jgi:hypothetical protein
MKLRLRAWNTYSPPLLGIEVPMWAYRKSLKIISTAKIAIANGIEPPGKVAGPSVNTSAIPNPRLMAMTP